MITIYTDGAAKGNPGPGGYGTILQYGDKEKELSEGFRMTTNNRMELLAVIVGLETIKKDGWNEKRVTFNTHFSTHIDAPNHMLADGKTLSD